MKKLIAFIALSMTIFAASSQNQPYLSDPRYGQSPEERTRNAELYNAFRYSYNIKDLDVASVQLKELLQKMPAAQENLYVYGIEIYKNFMANAKDEQQRRHYLDSILIMFDLRAKNFSEHPTRGADYSLTHKALMFNNYASEEQRSEAYKYFMEAIEASKVVIDKNDAELIGTYFKNLTQDFKVDEITTDDYMNRYQYIVEILENANNDDAKAIMNDIEAMFAQSGAANCDNIEKIFKPQYLADPNNPDLVKKILSLFARAKCATDFQMELLEKYYKNDPKPEVALLLAGAYEEKKDYPKAFEYINVAIDNEKDPAIKTSYLVRAAGQSLQMGNYREAAAFARRAMEGDPNNSKAAFMYASSIMSGITGCSGENRQYAYWLVADAFSQAIRMMGNDDPLRSEAQNAYNNLVANFPKKTDLFMLGLEEGQGYTVNCGWVSGRTTVRGR